MRDVIPTEHTVESQPPGRPGLDRQVTDRLASRLRTITLGGIGVLIIGVLLSIVRDGALPAHTTPLGSLPSALVGLNADALLTLGLLILLAAPAYGLIHLALAFLRAYDKLFAALSGGVLAILGLSLLIGMLSRGA